MQGDCLARKWLIEQKVNIEMAIDNIYHVFVSSTYADLKDERKKVSEAIAKAGFVPEGMELFPASSQSQFEFIKRVIDRCDYYILIIGGRYGQLGDDNLSYTEMEYEYALSRGISILAFLHRKPEKIEAGKTEKNPKNARRLQQFRSKLSEGTLVDFWENPDELSMKVAVALAQEAMVRPGVGWVRGDQARDPRITEELSLATMRIKELEAELRTQHLTERIVKFPESVASVDQLFEVELIISIRRFNGNEPPILDERHLIVNTSWKLIFIYASLAMTEVDSEKGIYRMILKQLLKEKENIGEDAHPEISSPLGSLQIRLQLEALSLIRAETEIRDVMGIRPLFDPSVGGRAAAKQPVKVWRLTEMGRRYMADELALKENRNFLIAST